MRRSSLRDGNSVSARIHVNDAEALSRKLDELGLTFGSLVECVTVHLLEGHVGLTSLVSAWARELEKEPAPDEDPLCISKRERERLMRYFERSLPDKKSKFRRTKTSTDPNDPFAHLRKMDKTEIRRGEIDPDVGLSVRERRELLGDIERELKLEKEERRLLKREGPDDFVWDD